MSVAALQERLIVSDFRPVHAATRPGCYELEVVKIEERSILNIVCENIYHPVLNQRVKFQ